MNKRYSKAWLIDKALEKEPNAQIKAWSTTDRVLGMMAGLLEGNETRKQMRAIFNAAFADEKTPRPKTKHRNARFDFHSSREWRAIRYRVLKIHGGRCQCCGASAADGVQIHVDHIKPRSKYPGLALELSNLQVLCVDCNLGKSNRDETDWRPLNAANDSNAQHIRSIVEGQ
jgi:hypothetical protein